jgi:tetratricopeptide (TPR) repeat protein
VGPLLAKAVASRPDGTALRYQFARHLEMSGKQAESCDQYLEILKQKPQWIIEDLYQVRRPFDRANRTVDLMRALQKTNFKLFSQPYYVIDLVSSMLSNRPGQATANSPENLEIALNLFEKAFNAFPTYRNQMLSRMYEPSLWKNPRIFELGKKAILPTAAEVQTNPWFGVDQIYSYGQGGQVNAQIHQFLNGIAATDKIGELTQAVESQVQKSPGWHGGAVILALIDLKSNRKEQAKNRLSKLIGDEEMLKTIPTQACWIVGQELDQFEDTRPMALKLFETAIKAPPIMSQIQYSPVARLVKLYTDLGRKEDARELLLTQSKVNPGVGYDAQYGSYLRIENSVWAAQQFAKLNCPVDAIRLFREVSLQDAILEQAAQWNGNVPQFYKSQVEKGMKDALASLDPANAKEAMTKLLAIPEKNASDASLLDVMLLVPEVSQLRDKSMQSSLIDLLVTISKDEVIAKGIRQRLDQLQQEHPADLSIGVTRSAYLRQMADKEASAAVADLLGVVNTNPLETVRAGRRPNSAQRRASLTHVPLWLVAKECLKTKDQREAGLALAERALEAARRQASDQFTAAILYDWGKIALETGDRQQAESKWSELLDIVTRRPEPKAPQAKPRTSARDPIRGPIEGTVVFVKFQVKEAPNSGPTAAPKRGPTAAPKTGPTAALKTAPAARRIPPLTISQFRLTIQIARAAAENDMPALSQKALKASLLGGIPVPDALNAYAGDPFGGAPPRLAPGTGNAPGLETEVADAIRNVIGKWQGPAYPAHDVYELLASLVFPENRANAIILYADSSKLSDAQVTSIGELLVHWAHAAGKLDELNNRLGARAQDPMAKISASVLRTGIALKRDRIEDASAALSELAQLVERGMTPDMVQLACHAALPAADREPLAKPAYTILKAAVNLQLRNPPANSSSSEAPIGKLVSKVNRHLANDPAEVKKFFDNYLAGRQQYYSRYSGTYGQMLQWRDWAAIADEAAKSGVHSVALDYMGRVSDFTYERSSRPSSATALAIVSREMSALKPEERYESWRMWTLPTPGRQSIRFVIECVEPVRVPKAFLATGSVRGALHSQDVLDNFTELLTAAKATNHLPELRDVVKQCYEQKLENAPFLYALVLVELGDVETGKQVIDSIVNTLTDRIKVESRDVAVGATAAVKPTPTGWADYLVYRACMRSPAFVTLYANQRRTLQRALQAVRNYPALARLDVDFALRAGMQEKPTIQPGDDPLLAHWFPASTKEKVPAGTRPWWAVQEGHLAHLLGAESDLLYFAYPVVGDFEFTVDGFKGSWAETEAGYGGVIVDAQKAGQMSIWSVGGHESINYPQAQQRDRGSFGTLTIKVANGRMQYSLNNYRIYEEPVSDTSPWITLYTGYARATTFRNPRFIGKPEIPREVSLVRGDRMDGWNTSFYNERQPRRRLMAIKPTGENDLNAYYQRDEPTEFAWEAKDGLLLGNSLSSQQTDGWAYYHRPLREREAFTYEFFYNPSSSAAHPTMGRMALLLEPDGVREHWIARVGWDQDVLGVSIDNRIVNKAAQTGPKPLPLKAGDWNLVRLALTGDTIQIDLNGERVYERPLDAELDRRFGLLRPQGQSLKVREPKLTGAWPQTLDDGIRTNLLASAKQYTTADRRLINKILSERLFEPDVNQVVADSHGLAPEKAYEKLIQWVLPSPDHSGARLYYQFEPVSDKSSDEPKLICAAIELVKVAADVGKLDELARKIGEIKTYGDVAERAKSALTALVALESHKFDDARHAMTALHGYVAKGVAKDLALGDRAPEFVVAWQAAQFPELQFAALELADELLAKQRDEKFKSDDANWTAAVHMLSGRVDALMLKPSFAVGTGNPLQQWALVPYHKPNSRRAGHSASQWLFRPGMVQHLSGGTWSQLFFQSPLRGNFEILAERSHHGHREVSIAYGMHSAEPRYDFKAKRIYTVMHGSKDSDGEISIPRQTGFLADYRIAVDQNKVTTFVNDVKLHEETLMPQPDPWVVLQATTPGSQSTVRNLRIRGNPVIPDEIDLIEIAGWNSWRADMYGEWFSLDGSDATAPWKKSGDEIQGQARQNVAGQDLESLLMYQRPMLEDGVIEFESYFIPGEFEVHPAVGRTVLVARPGGVRLHSLTDAQYELDRKSADDDQPVADAAAKVEFKEREWNRYRIALKGDQLTLAINGADVATVKLAEPANERFFGLFRYGDKTKCRVRKLVYRGEWPKTLPPIEQQQLARSNPSEKNVDQTRASIFNFTEPIEKLRASGLVYEGPANGLTQTDRGTRLLLERSTGYGSWPKLFFRQPIHGDCTVTLDFEDLKLSPPKTGWGCNFVLRASLLGSPDTYVDAGFSQTKPEIRNLLSSRRIVSLEGKDKHHNRHMPTTAASGRLRLVRVGSTISTYYAAKGSDDFQLGETWAVGATPLKSISVSPGASDDTASVDLVLNQLTVQLAAPAKGP